MVVTIATVAEVQNIVGANASATYNATTPITQYVEDAEAALSLIAQYDFVANWSSIPARMKPFLRRIVSHMAAMDVLQTDLSAVSLQEAQTRLDYCRDVVVAGLEMLTKETVIDFIKQGDTA